MSQYITPLLWSFLPSQATHFILPTLSNALPALLPPSPPGSPGYQRNFRLVLTALTIGWLAYCFVSEPDTTVDWYALLGVGHDATDDELKRAFRSLSRKYHPDRQPTQAQATASSEHFILVRQAYETLTTPARRFAYDRFGPASAKWHSDKDSVNSLMWAGAQSSVGFYVSSGIIMLLLGFTGRASAGAYWRNVLLATVLVLEAYLVLSPTSSILNRPAYANVSLLRRLGADIGVAISQLAGVWEDAVPTNAQASLAIAGHLQNFAFGELAGVLEPVVEREEELLSGMEGVVAEMRLEGGSGRVGVEPGRGLVVRSGNGVVAGGEGEWQGAEREEEGDEQRRSMEELMDIAVRLPLPSTPPLEGPRRRSARLSSKPPA